MFGHRFFGARYYGNRYWGTGGNTPPGQGGYWGHRYFGARYFGPRYFGWRVQIPPVGSETNNAPFIANMGLMMFRGMR